ncbi:sugar transferase [Vagococcus fluvialis]|uniref:sugar transferase n=1 Tax=Vagococcus fluvialis TaxID=2738 RepID=UPI001D0B0E59|nr:sugar transferase [Vagococcus fluvialis]UDM73884.1 sugar transferase [Vagococcus fluvialis]
MYKKYFKRVLDICLSGSALIILFPVIITVATLVRVKLGSPIIFSQKRPGKNEKIFSMYKFRTMTSEKDNEGNLLPDSERLTEFGRMLRSTSLDELPGLINILKGDMSIIGPRPLAVQYLPYYNEFEKKRHTVRPGLSGLAQVNGRNTASWEERFEYDIAYINNITFLSDLKIVINTVFKVFKREDIGERGVDAPIDFDEERRNEANHVNS